MRPIRPILLLVEDDPTEAELALRELKKSDLAGPGRPAPEVLVARDGQAALDLLLGQDGHPALNPTLVVLDMKLPGMSGLDVVSKLRSEHTTRYLPTVLFTSSDLEDDIRDAYARGVNSYVTKPTDYSDYVQALSTIRKYWLDVCRLPNRATA